MQLSHLVAGSPGHRPSFPDPPRLPTPATLPSWNLFWCRRRRLPPRIAAMSSVSVEIGSAKPSARPQTVAAVPATDLAAPPATRGSRGSNSRSAHRSGSRSQICIPEDSNIFSCAVYDRMPTSSYHSSNWQALGSHGLNKKLPDFEPIKKRGNAAWWMVETEETSKQTFQKWVKKEMVCSVSKGYDIPEGMTLADCNGGIGL